MNLTKGDFIIYEDENEKIEIEQLLIYYHKFLFLSNRIS